jgi:hypothetical protein
VSVATCGVHRSSDSAGYRHVSECPICVTMCPPYASGA